MRSLLLLIAGACRALALHLIAKIFGSDLRRGGRGRWLSRDDQGGEKTGFHPFYRLLKRIILPRQARDKHGENSRKERRFLKKRPVVSQERRELVRNMGEFIPNDKQCEVCLRKRFFIPFPL